MRVSDFFGWVVNVRNSRYELVKKLLNLPKLLLYFTCSFRQYVKAMYRRQYRGKDKFYTFFSRVVTVIHSVDSTGVIGTVQEISATIIHYIT